MLTMYSKWLGDAVQVRVKSQDSAEVVVGLNGGGQLTDWYVHWTADSTKVYAVTCMEDLDYHGYDFEKKQPIAPSITEKVISDALQRQYNPSGTPVGWLCYDHDHPRVAGGR